MNGRGTGHDVPSADEQVRAGAVRERILFAVPIVYGLAAATFFVLRPFGRWAENDTASLADAINGVIRAQHLLPSDGTAYLNGYVYQALMAFLGGFTGLSVTSLQQLLSPFLFVVILIPLAWVAYRELTGRPAIATLATVLLLLQPEFLFVSMRGSHEKITRALMLLALLLLARSFRPGSRKGHFAVHVVLFYVVGYGIVASNNLFGTSFIAAIAAALLASWLLGTLARGRVAPLGGRLTQRLLYNTVILLGVAFVFTFYAYPPASNQLSIYQEIWKKVTVLLLNVATERAPAGDPYGLVVAGWISLPVYFLVSLADWLLVVASLVFWLRDGWQWFVVRRVTPSPSVWLLWLLFAAFAIQGALSIAVDLSGAIGSNFQHRAFASFALIAVPVFARGAAPLLSRAGRVTWLARYGLAVLVACLAVLGLLKATNEPLLSNKWMFYEAEEIQAIRWATSSMRYATISTDFDERLTTAYFLEVLAPLPTDQRPPGGDYLGQYRRQASSRDFLITDVTRLRAQRLGTTVPEVADQLRVYDNGSAQFYHLVPQTPYQR